eukprot:14485289-Alexandrium_andersonii.AAC.1
MAVQLGGAPTYCQHAHATQGAPRRLGSMFATSPGCQVVRGFKHELFGTYGILAAARCDACASGPQPAGALKTP